MSEFAHFDAESPLGAAMCVSSFLVSVDGGGLLVGRMAAHEAWASLDHVASGKTALEGWALPAGHTRIGEDPAAAAQRIAREQLRAAVPELRLARVLSYAGPLPSRRQETHWDLCFVYDAELTVTDTPPWFAELRRVPLPSLRRDRFVRGHGDVLADLGLLLDG